MFQKVLVNDLIHLRLIKSRLDYVNALLNDPFFTRLLGCCLTPAANLWEWLLFFFFTVIQPGNVRIRLLPGNFKRGRTHHSCWATVKTAHCATWCNFWGLHPVFGLRDGGDQRAAVASSLIIKVHSWATDFQFESSPAGSNTYKWPDSFLIILLSSRLSLAMNHFLLAKVRSLISYTHFTVFTYL